GFIDPDEIQRAGSEQVMRVKTFFIRQVFVQELLAIEVGPRIVMPEMRRIIIVRLHLIQVTSEFIKSLFLRNRRSVLIAQAPLSDQTCVIPSLLEQFSNRDIVRTKRLGAIASNPGMARMQPRHQGAARWRANRAAGIKAGEADALGS